MSSLVLLMIEGEMKNKGLETVGNEQERGGYSSQIKTSVFSAQTTSRRPKISYQANQTSDIDAAAQGDTTSATYPPVWTFYSIATYFLGSSAKSVGYLENKVLDFLDHHR